MKQTTTKGRIMAFLMAIVTVFSLIPILGGATADAAIKNIRISNSEAMNLINQRMTTAYYTPQMSRSHSRVKENGQWIPDPNGSKNGICTWCAITNLLNRRIALETSAFSSAKKFTISDVAYVASGKKEAGVQWTNENYAQKDKLIYIKNYNGSDHYNNVFSNGSYSFKARSYTFASSDRAQKKSQLVELLDKHPEGIVVQFSNSNGNHGVVFTGYYYQNGSVKFYVQDTAGSTYGNSKNWKIPEVHIGKSYGNGGNEDKVIDGLKYYVALCKEPIDIDLTGFKNTLTYGNGYNIPGRITSNANIATVNARVYSGQDQYQTTVNLTTGGKAEKTLTNVGVKELNITDTAINDMKMGGLRKGDYYFEVKVTDVNGKTYTERTAFSVR